jgi:hypothetical protein
MGRSDLVPERLPSETDPVAISSILAAMLPALITAALLLFRVQDPFGRIPALVWVVPFLGPLAAVLLGHRARKRARHASGRTGLATLGLALGYLGLGVYLVLAVLALIAYWLLEPWGHP